VVLALDRNVYRTVQGMQLKKESTDNLVEYRLNKLENIGLLGCGGFGKVTLVNCGVTNNVFALKSLSKGHVVLHRQEQAVLNEKDIMLMTHSPFLVRLAATFNSSQHIHFLLEPAIGGELFTTYQRRNLHGSEKHARFYFACVLRAIDHLHERQIVYRDLKPENILLDAQGYCKLTDFGLAKFLIGHTFTTCGTPDYFAPEMVLGLGHTTSLDWWTLGIFLYELMMGSTPFAAQDTMQVFHNINRGIDKVPFPPRRSWGTLVKEMCKPDPQHRLPVRDAGIRAVEEQNWFREGSFKWNMLNERKMPAPYKPAVKSPQDLSNFEADDADTTLDIPYKDTGTGWDKSFEKVMGPASFS